MRSKDLAIQSRVFVYLVLNDEIVGEIFFDPLDLCAAVLILNSVTVVITVHDARCSSRYKKIEANSLPQKFVLYS